MVDLVVFYGSFLHVRRYVKIGPFFRHFGHYVASYNDYRSLGLFNSKSLHHRSVAVKYTPEGCNNNFAIFGSLKQTMLTLFTQMTPVWSEYLSISNLHHIFLTVFHVRGFPRGSFFRKTIKKSVAPISQYFLIFQ